MRVGEQVVPTPSPLAMPESSPKSIQTPSPTAATGKFTRLSMTVVRSVAQNTAHRVHTIIFPSLFASQGGLFGKMSESSSASGGEYEMLGQSVDSDGKH